MGLRDRLKNRVRRLVGSETDQAPPPPRREGLARPPAAPPASAARPPAPPLEPSQPSPAETAPPAAVAAPAPLPVPAARPDPAAMASPTEQPRNEEPADEQPADEQPTDALLGEEPTAELPPDSLPDASEEGEVWFESDYATTDAPTRTAHHRSAFETTAAALEVRVFDRELDRWLEFSCEPGEYVLDAADRAGLELPYSCRSGGCLSCSGRLLEGEADMGEQYVLEEEHVAAGFRLLCCTTVRTDAAFLGNQEDEVS